MRGGYYWVKHFQKGFNNAWSSKGRCSYSALRSHDSYVFRSRFRNTANDQSSPIISRGTAFSSEHILRRIPAFSFLVMSNGFIMVGVLSGGYSLFSVGCLTGVGVCGIIISSTNRNLMEGCFYEIFCLQFVSQWHTWRRDRKSVV